MSFPSPTEKQAVLFWRAVTGLAWGILAALLILLAWVVGWVFRQLSAVLIPLAIAGILSYVLDPVVAFIQRRGIDRQRAILWVFIVSAAVILGFIFTIGPRLIGEANELIHRLPDYVDELNRKVEEWVESSPRVRQTKETWGGQLRESLQNGLERMIPIVSAWIWEQMARVASWAGLVLGLILVPFVTYYFLLEAPLIQKRWTAYLPLRESRLKEETVFILAAINESLMVFFRGRVLVAVWVGVLTTIGYVAMGLSYGVLLGILAGFLGIIPYIGTAISLVPAIILAFIQWGDWAHPLLVLGLSAAVHVVENFIITPKIIGDRVGLHPLTIMIAVLCGTTLMGGLIGGFLAIPLAAALRVLLDRYIWRPPGDLAISRPPEA